MTCTQLVIKNVWRNRQRTLLTTASVTVSVFLLAMMSATYRYLYALNDEDSTYLVLLVRSRISGMIPLPLSYRQQIAKLPAVDSVTPVVTYDAHYGGEDSFLAALACDPGTILKVFSGWRLPEDQKTAFLKEKVAMIAGRKTAEKYGWKIGDHIPLRSARFNVTLDLVLRAIYTSPDDEGMLSFHWDYLNDALGGKMGTAFWVLARSPEDVPKLVKAIDELFRNTDVETRTETMKQYVLHFLAMLGNVKLILLSVGTAVVFAILLIVANTMAMSIRERTAELAVLRTLGFRTRQLLGLLISESLAISLAGATIGCLSTGIVCKLVKGYRVGGLVPFLPHMDMATANLILSVALMVSLGSTLVPAYRALHVSVAEALRFVG